MPTAIERILEQVRALPAKEQAEILGLLSEEICRNQEARREMVRSIPGKYRDLISSSEDFIARKAAEVETEEARRSR